MNPTFKLGGELEVRRVGFGAMRIVDDREEGIRVLRRALELGVTLIDTADIYGAGASEEIVAEALHPYPEGLVIATKGGTRPQVAGPHTGRTAGVPAARVRREPAPVEARAHRSLPAAPPRSGGADRGVGRRAPRIARGGEDPADRTLERVARPTPCSADPGGAHRLRQNEFNRGLLISDVVLEACESEGIAFMPWRPLGEGLRDSAFELRWLLDHSPVILPIPGTSKVSHLEDNMRVVA